MSSQAPLFDRYAPPDDICARKSRGSPTSEAAHEAIAEGKEAMRLRILSYLARRGAEGATWSEISEALGIAYANSGRCSELKRDGRIVENGERRATPSGCWAAVVVLRRFA